MKNLLKISVSATALLIVAACAQQEEPAVVVQAETPIYAKDGTLIGMRPTVSNGGSDFDDFGRGGSHTDAEDGDLDDFDADGGGFPDDSDGDDSDG